MKAFLECTTLNILILLAIKLNTLRVYTQKFNKYYMMLILVNIKDQNINNWKVNLKMWNKYYWSFSVKPKIESIDKKNMNKYILEIKCMCENNKLIFNHQNILLQIF